MKGVIEMNTKSLPAFQGKPLIPIPEEIPAANFLEREFGQAVLKEYQGRVKADYNDAHALRVLSYEGNVIQGSNPFAVVLINQILSQEKLRTVTPLDIEAIVKCNILGLQDHYEDLALILRSESAPNAYLARDLASQIKARQNSPFPVMIPLNSLEMAKDAESDHGLAFKLKEDAEIIPAPQLNHIHNQKRFSATDVNGLPIFDAKGNKTLYTGESGWSRLYLGRDLDLVSYGDDLAVSGSDGRVVVVRGGATSQNLDKYVAELRKERESEVEAIEKRFEAAMKLLKNN